MLRPRKIFLVILVFALIFSGMPTYSASPGSMWTTVMGDTGQTNSFTLRQDVYVYGEGLTDGEYYVKVTTTPGVLLGTSVGTGNEKPFVVSGGTAHENLWSMVETPLGKQGYDHHGGQYKVWISTDPNFNGQNPGTTTTKTKTISVSSCMVMGYKFFDENQNGVWDEGEDPLPDVGFTLEGGDLSVTLVTSTDSEGYFEYIDIAPGTYTLVEDYGAMMTTPDNENGIITIELSKGDVWNEDIGNYIPPTGSITVVKDVSNVEGDSTEFEVTVYNEGGAVDSQMIVDEGAGYTWTGIPYGEYWIEETPEAGYTLVGYFENSGQYENDGIIMVGEQTEDVTITVENTKDPEPTGSITIMKDVSNVSDPHDPTEFEVTVYNEGGAVDSQMIVDEQAGYTWTGIPYGEYWIEETPEAGYTLVGYFENSGQYENDGIIMVGEQTEDVTITVENTKDPDPTGSITIMKDVSNVSDPHDPTEFEVTVYNEGGAVDSQMIVDEQAGYTWTGIPYGEYWIEETPEAGYTLVGYFENSGQYENDGIIMVGEQTEDVTITVENTKDPEPTGIIVIKKDVTNVEGDPTEFEVSVYNEGGIVDSQMIVDEGSGYTWYGVPYGEYWIEETPKAGYTFAGYTEVPADDMHDGIFTLGERMEIIEITIENTKNPEPTGSITVMKDVSNVSDPHDPTEFEVTVYNEGGAVDSQMIVDEQAGYTWTGIPYGEYWIEETPEAGYTLVGYFENSGQTENDGIIMVGEETEDVTVTVENTKDPETPEPTGSITINKMIQRDNDYMNGYDNGYGYDYTLFDVYVYNEEQEEVASGHISEMGAPLVVSGLPYGEYTVVEIVSPGYVLEGYWEDSGEANDGKVIIGEEIGDILIEDVDVMVENSMIPEEMGKIIISKDVDNTTSGAIFTVKIYEGEDAISEMEVDSGSISETGEAFESIDLPYGTYRIVETDIPSSYYFVSFDESVDDGSEDGIVTLGPDQSVIEVMVTNRILTYTSSDDDDDDDRRTGGTTTRRTVTEPEEEVPSGPVMLLISEPEPVEVLLSIPEEEIPSLPFTGGLFETEFIMLGFGAATFLSGLVMNMKRRRK